MKSRFQRWLVFTNSSPRRAVYERCAFSAKEICGSNFQPRIAIERSLVCSNEY